MYISVDLIKLRNGLLIHNHKCNDTNGIVLCLVSVYFFEINFSIRNQIYLAINKDTFDVGISMKYCQTLKLHERHASMEA